MILTIPGARRRLAVVLLLLLILTACRTSSTNTGTVVVPSVAPSPTMAVTTDTAGPIQAAFIDPVPSIFVKLVNSEPTTLDPALAYDLPSDEVIQNVMESLIALNRAGDGYVPALADTVPSLDNGLISADGLTYTFPVRRGVTFHDGGKLDPHDVAYSIRRGLLQSDPSGPQWLFIEPILGFASGDITEPIAGGSYAGDPEALRANAAPEYLLAVCQQVMRAVAVDDDAGTVTITLAQPWAPFLSLLPLLRVIDQEWAIAQGDWSGECADWPEHYSPGPSASPLHAVANGTGPYRLDHWTPGEEVVLEAFDGYWRTKETPLWEGGPYGPARIPTIHIRIAPEWGTRLAALRSGDADYVEVPFENQGQLDDLVGERCNFSTGACIADPVRPDAPLRKWEALPTVQRADIFMNLAVAPGSPYLGSGRLDGEGIPPDFFSDLKTRQAMATCFDYDTYNTDVLLGHGVRNNGPIISGMLGYNPDGPMYEHDRDACAALLAAAWDGALPATGFRLPFVYSSVVPGGREVAGILAAELQAINPKYVLEPIELPWPNFLEAMDSGQLPMFRSGWFEDYHDPHAWAAPFTVGIYGGMQGLPEELSIRFAELVAAGISTTDSATREAAYFALQQLFYDNVPTIILAQRPGFRIEPRWVEGFAYHAGMSADSPPYYTLSTIGE